MKPRNESARFGIVLYDGVEPIDVGGTVGVLSMARRILPLLNHVVLARTAGPVTLASGLVTIATHGLDEAPECDVHIVCGGPGWPDAAQDPIMQRFLRGLAPERTASVCTGAMILAAAGVLEGRQATTRRHAAGAEPDAPLSLLGRSGTIRATPAAIVDDIVVTGGGVSLAIDATLYLIGRTYDRGAQDEVARMIEYDRAYAANSAALGIV